MHRPSSLFVLGLAALIAGPLLADSPAAQLSARLGEFDTLAASFRQTTVDANDRTLQDNTGTLWVSHPARFRIETAEPFAQTLVSDGRSFWTYDADLEQVIVRYLDASVQEVPILLFGGDPERVVAEYEVSYFEDEARDYFVLTPRSASSLFQTLSIEFSGALPDAITLSDSLGQRTRIQLADARVNEPVSPDRFLFEAPEGADVIDDRADE